MKHWIIAFLLTAVAYPLQAKNKTLLIYHDADYSVNKSSAEAMKMGLLTALDEVDNTVSGYQLKLIAKDHRGNIKRSLKNMKNFLKDQSAVFMLGGLHSPPYIKNRAFINENEIPLLVPWAAGGPITRYSDGLNWVFRLSVDDTLAGKRISHFALNNQNCKRPHLILEDTPWGKSNFNTMTQYLTDKVPFDVSWFGWSTKHNTARILLRNAASSGADCILFVANYTESTVFFNAALSLPKEHRLPFISHWGLTGGDVDKLMTKDIKAGVEVNFIQSCFSFTSPATELSTQVVNRAKKLFPEAFSDPQRVKSPAGFIHAYDLGKLMIAALQSIEISDDIKQTRRDFRTALEDLKRPIQGLVKQYNQPFTAWSETSNDAHEALKLNDFCMATFGEQNQINIIANR